MLIACRKVIVAFVLLGALLIGARGGYAADASAVSVKYSGFAEEQTEIAQWDVGAKFYTDKNLTTAKFPDELGGLEFTRRPYNAKNAKAEVTIRAPNGATVFLLIGAGTRAVSARQAVVAAGWEQIGSATGTGLNVDVYKKVFNSADSVTFEGGGATGVVVAAAKLELAAAAENPDDNANDKPAAAGDTAPAVVPDSPITIDLGGAADQIRTGGGGHFLVFHVKDSKQLTVVDVLAGKVVKEIPAEGDICYCMDRDKLILVLNNQQVIQRWSLATLTREKTVMLPDDKPVKRAIMGSAGAGPLLLWTDGGCKLFNVNRLKLLSVNGTVQNDIGFGPWISADGMTICDWGWTSGPYSLMRLSNLTATSVDSRVVNVDSEDFNESWAMPSADGTQLVRHGACVYDASTDNLVALAAGPLKDDTVLPTEDPRFLLALRGEEGGDNTSSVAIVSAFDRRVLYTFHKAVSVTGGMIGTQSGRICSEPRAHYLPADNKLVLIPNSNDKVVVYPFDLATALKATGADYLYVISKPHTVLSVGQKFDYQIQTMSSAGGVKFKLEEGPVGLTISDAGRVTWKASASADGEKVPVVITLSDASGEEITHAIELHVVKKPVPKPDATAPRDATANAGKQAEPKGGTNPQATPAPKKIPDDPELKTLGDKMAKKLEDDLDADAVGNNEYTSHFSVSVGNAQRSSPAGGHMVLSVMEDRAFLVGGDFVEYFSHIDIELKKVNGIWTCTTAQSTLDMATTSSGPLDVPFPPKTHDQTRSIRGLLDDVQNDPTPPKNGAPVPPPAASSERA